MKKINILIGSMLAALLLLVAFQWYWIDNAIRVKREQFDRKVYETLNETVKEIEKLEVIYLAKQKILNEEKKKLVDICKIKPKINSPIEESQITEKNNNADSLKLSVNRNPNKPQEISAMAVNNGFAIKKDAFNNRIIIIPQSEVNFIKGYIQEEYVSFENFRKTQTERNRKQVGVNNLMQLINFESDNNYPAIETDYPQDFDNTNIYFSEEPEKPVQINSELILNDEKKKANNTRIEKAEKKKEEKTNIVKNIFTDLLLGKRSIYERMGNLMLDTLLHQKFKNNGINIPFEYGVKDNGNVIFASLKPAHIQDPLNMAYKVRLFPNDAIAQDQFLHVNFPAKDDYILSNMWSVFGSSLLMLMMVGGIFYYSVNTMLSQKKLSNIKNDFINNMSHELKTPVTTIALALEVINDKSLIKTKEKTRRYLNIIEEENKRLGNQVEKVLQLAQLEKGDVKLNFELLDLNVVLNNVINNLSVQLEKNHVKLDLNLGAHESKVSGDEVHLTNIFFNLMDNAIKYSHQTPEIKIISTNKDGVVQISIIDKGIGIEKDQISKIFDKFYRVPKGNLHDAKGFGLGLSYVKNILKLHNGGIEVFSKFNEGSEFVVTLPLS